MNPDPIIVPHRLQEQLSQLLSDHKIVFLSACTGWGKTAAVRECLKSRPCAYLNVLCGRTPRFSCKEPLVVLDDFQNLSPHLAERVAGALRRSPRRQRFLILSRGSVPVFLLPYQYSGSLRLLTAEDLALGQEEIACLTAARHLSLSAEDLFRLHHESHGYPPLIHLLLELFPFHGLDKQSLELARKRLNPYFDAVLYSRLDAPVRELLLGCSLFHTMTTSLAETLLDEPKAEELLTRISDTTGLICPEPGGIWQYAHGPLFLPYLRWKAGRELSADRTRQLYLLGAAWCARHRDYAHAAQYYRAAGSRPGIVDTLVRAVRHEAEFWTLLRLSDSLRSLGDEEIRGAPELMYAMARLSYMTLDLPGLAAWYQALEAHAAGGGQDLAHRFCFCLDLSRQDLSPADLAEKCQSLVPALNDGPVLSGCFSPTGGLPSILRGERDLSEWMLQAPEGSASQLREALRLLLDRRAVGLDELLLAEYRLETGADIAPLLLQWRPLQLRIRAEGTLASEFVCVVLMARFLCGEGQLPEAVAYLMRFRQRAEAEGAGYLLENIDAARCRMSLLEDSLYASDWFAAQPPGQSGFSLLDGFRLLTKARCHIKREEYHTALLMLGHLLERYGRGSRPLDTLEALILAAICQFRMGAAGWQEQMDKAFALGVRYGYIAVFAREGAALASLLEAYTPGGVPADYWGQITRKTLAQSVRYPMYLKPYSSVERPLTPSERTILMLLLRHKSNREIGQLLNIKDSTVRAHLRNLFRKLGVHTREEACQAAVRLRLDR